MRGDFDLRQIFGRGRDRGRRCSTFEFVDFLPDLGDFLRERVESFLELAEAICDLAGAHRSLVSFVPDRPGHDFRYDLAWDRLRALGWKPEVGFEEGLAETVAWFRRRLGAEAEAVRR